MTRKLEEISSIIGGTKRMGLQNTIQLYLFHPPGSKLAKLMQRKEAVINSASDTRIKIVERGV